LERTWGGLRNEQYEFFKRGVSNEDEKRNGRSDVDKGIEIHDIL
jgi:hypothetical protein